jgi:hypothetical protein
MGYSKATRRAVVALAVVATLGGGALAARSRRGSAAWVAFRHPERVIRDEGLEPVPAPAPIELEQPEIAHDFEPVTDADIADAGALTSFTLPDLPIPISKRTMRFVAYFAANEKGRRAFSERFRRAGRYRAHVEQALRDREVPEDLLWLVAIVSGFEPQATSPKGAAGLFQFMPETAQKHGLAQSEWIDERRSITKATRAGVALLRSLFERYKRWDLALAAYNMGEENLDGAIERLRKRRKRGEADKPIELGDLAEARLVPKETANFVPQVQAFALVAANRGRFGLDDLDVEQPFSLAEIAVPPDTPLSLVARAAGVSIATARDYNPDLLRDRTPPGSSDAMVNIPADKLPGALAAMPILLAKEREKQEAAAASASASAPLAEPPPSASTTASAEPAPPPRERFVLSNGVVIERRSSPSSEIVIAPHVEVATGARGRPRIGDRSFDAEVVTARGGDLAAALDRAARSVTRLATGAGDAAVEARRRMGTTRRSLLDKAPYGGVWLALGERYFPRGSALGGAVLAAPAMPFQTITIAEPGAESPAFRAPVRVTVEVTGGVDRKALEPLAERAFADVLASRTSIAPLSAEERLTLPLPVPSPRIVFSWLVPTETAADRAALMLAVVALTHDEHGRIARALGPETHVAVRVHGLLDVGDVASVLSIEVSPSVLHDVTAVERELDVALAGFVSQGPREAELAAAKEQLRARFHAARGRAGTTGDRKEATLARLTQLEKRAAEVSAGELAALVGRALARSRRVVVIAQPKG